MPNEENQIKELNNKIVDLLMEDKVGQEIAFATLMTLCLNIIFYHEVSRDDFIRCCEHLYDEVANHNQEIVH